MKTNSEQLKCSASKQYSAFTAVILNLWMISTAIIQIKATEKFFPVVLFIMLLNVVLTFESMVEILKCDH